MMPLIRLLAAVIATLFPTMVAAQQLYPPSTGPKMPPTVCTGLAGCPEGPENTLYTNILPAAASLLIQVAGAAAVIWVVIAGVRLVASYGDETQIGMARKSVLYALGGLGLALCAATIVSFVTSENYGQADPTDFVFGTGGLVAAALRIILVLFNVGFIIAILLAGVRMVSGQGSPDEFKKGGEIIKWCIIGAVLVNIARVLVQALLNIGL